MKKTLQRMSVSVERIQPVPKTDTDRLKSAVRDKVIKPIEERAKQQREIVNRARARQVRKLTLFA